LHEMQMRNSTWSNLALTVRHLSADVALAHLEWRIEGDRDADGGRREPRQGLFTWVLAMEGDGALIAAAHNTNVVSAPNPGPSRAPARGS
jgi:ketosteroid isomerase-like protein